MLTITRRGDAALADASSFINDAGQEVDTVDVYWDADGHVGHVGMYCTANCQPILHVEHARCGGEKVSWLTVKLLELFGIKDDIQLRTDLVRARRVLFMRTDGVWTREVTPEFVPTAAGETGA